MAPSPAARTTGTGTARSPPEANAGANRPDAAGVSLAMDVTRYLAEEVGRDHADGFISRREALRRLGLMGFTASAAAAVLAACGDGGSPAPETTATTAAPTTAAPTTTAAAPTTGAQGGPVGGQPITFPGPRGTLQGHYAAPAAQPRGAVLVVHENRGLTDHIRSVAGRFAGDGYSALAIDLLSEEGGTAAVGDQAAAMAALSRAPGGRFVADMRAGVAELERRAGGRKVGMIGFCFGGGQVWNMLNAGEPRVAAAAPFYGPAPESPDFSRSKAAVLAVYAANDPGVNATRDRAVAALERAGLTHEVMTFPDVGHAFFNDTGPRYNAEAATRAYRAVLDWFGRHLA